MSNCIPQFLNGPNYLASTGSLLYLYVEISNLLIYWRRSVSTNSAPETIHQLSKYRVDPQEFPKVIRKIMISLKNIISKSSTTQIKFAENVWCAVGRVPADCPALSAARASAATAMSAFVSRTYRWPAVEALMFSEEVSFHYSPVEPLWTINVTGLRLNWVYEVHGNLW